jgi:hypothetical protein
MRSWPRFWLAACAVVLLSLAPKLMLGVLRSRAPAPPTPIERLRAHLVAAGGRPVEPIGAEQDARTIVGWRFLSGGCVGQAFVSGLPGVLDYEAHRHAATGSRLVYFYRGSTTERPPSRRLAVDVMAFRLTSEFIPARVGEPRYVIVVYPGSCANPPSLGLDRFRAD